MSAYVPADLRRQVRERFGDCCAYCRTAERLNIAIFECEHILPRSAGGATVFENLCLACPTCNRYKADRTQALEPDTQEVLPLFHPQRDVWSEHFAWDESATEIVALTPVGRGTIRVLRMNRPELIRVRRLWVAMAEHPPDLG
jgi:hypothetical protein